jgi:hypothetical protein
MVSASPTLLQVPPPLLPSRALKVGDVFLSIHPVSPATQGRRDATVATPRPYIVRCVKKLTAVLILAAMLSAGHAADYAPQEFDFSELGTVESIRQVPILELLPNVFEHAVRPQTIDELVIRTDDGRTVILHDEATQRFAAGQRVRLVSSTHGQRVEHE